MHHCPNTGLYSSSEHLPNLPFCQVWQCLSVTSSQRHRRGHKREAARKALHPSQESNVCEGARLRQHAPYSSRPSSSQHLASWITSLSTSFPLDSTDKRKRTVKVETWTLITWDVKWSSSCRIQNLSHPNPYLWLCNHLHSHLWSPLAIFPKAFLHFWVSNRCPSHWS